MAIGSSSARLNFCYEFAYGTSETAAECNKSFGDISNFSANIDNSMISVDGIGSQDPAAQVAGNFVGTWTADVTCRDFWWLSGLIADSSDAGATPYTHTFTPTTLPPSMTMMYAADDSTDSVRLLYGAQINSATINVNTGDAITATIEGVYKAETESAANIQSQVAGTDIPFTAADSTLTLWGNALTAVKNVTLAYTRNAKPVFGIGDRTPTSRYLGMRKVEITASLPYYDVSKILDNMYGTGGSVNTTTVAEPSGATTLSITNGLASSNERTLLWTLPTATVFPNTHTVNMAPGELFNEEFTVTGRTLTNVVWSNNTATQPADPAS